MPATATASLHVRLLPMSAAPSCPPLPRKHRQPHSLRLIPHISAWTALHMSRQARACRCQQQGRLFMPVLCCQHLIVQGPTYLAPHCRLLLTMHQLRRYQLQCFSRQMAFQPPVGQPASSMQAAPVQIAAHVACQSGSLAVSQHAASPEQTSAIQGRLQKLSNRTCHVSVRPRQDLPSSCSIGLGCACKWHCACHSVLSTHH